jgi:hypothetical protein
MSHLSPAHHETSKHDSPYDTKIKVKQQKHPGFEFKPRHANDSSQIKPRYWLLGFSIFPLMNPLRTQKHKVWILNPRSNEAQLEDQKAKKSSRRSFRRGKTAKPVRRHKKR